MIQPHIKCKKGDVAEWALLPGDPKRIDSIKNLFDTSTELQYNREFRTITGKYKSSSVSATSTGIGCPSAAIAVEELANIGTKNFIRIGTCGGLLKEMKPGDIVIPTSAMCFDGTTKEYDENIEQVESNKEITEALIQAAKKLGIKYFTGINRTHDVFYESLDKFVKLKGREYVSSEMECSVIFLISKLRNLKAGAILVVNTPEAPEDVEKHPNSMYKLYNKDWVREGIENAVKISLEAIKILEESKK